MDTVIEALLFIITEDMSVRDVLDMADALESVGLHQDAMAFLLAVTILASDPPVTV